MNVVNLKILTDYCTNRRDLNLTKQINAWIREVQVAKWQNSRQLRARYPKAKIITKKDVVFQLLGNNYRLWVKVNYLTQVIFIKQIGTHADYDRWNIKKGKEL